MLPLRKISTLHLRTLILELFQLILQIIFAY